MKSPPSLSNVKTIQKKKSVWNNFRFSISKILLFQRVRQMQAFMPEEATARLDVSQCVTRSKCQAANWHLSIIPVRIPPQVLGLLEGTTTIKLQWFQLPSGSWVILDDSAHLSVLMFSSCKVEILICYSSALHKRLWEKNRSARFSWPLQKRGILLFRDHWSDLTERQVQGV